MMLCSLSDNRGPLGTISDEVNTVLCFGLNALVLCLVYLTAFKFSWAVTIK